MDEDQLEWLFNLVDNVSAPGQHMAAALGQVDKAMGVAGQGSSKLESTLDKLGGTLSEISGKLGKVHESAETIKHLEIGELLLEGFEHAKEIIGEVIEKVVELGKEIVHAAGTAERQKLSFNLLLGPEGAEETIAYIDKIAKHTDLTREELKGLAQEAIFKGFKAEQLANVLPAALDISAFRGGGLGNAQEAISALGRIKMSGRVDMRSLRPLGLTEASVMGPLEKELGLTRKELEKQMGEGKVDADRIINAVYGAVAAKEKGPLGTGGLAGGNTLLASLHKIAGAPEAFFEAFAETKGFEKISSFLNKLVNVLDPTSDFGKKMGTALSATFDKIFGDIDEDKIIETVTSVLDGALQLIQKLPGWIEDTITTIKGWDISWRDVSAAIEATGATIKAITTVVQFLGGVLEGIVHSLQSIAEWFPKAFSKENEGKVPHLFDGGKAANDVTDAFFDEIHKSNTQAFEAGKGMTEGLIDGVQQKLEMHSPSKVFERMGQNVGKGFAMGIDDSSDIVDGAMSGTFAPDVGSFAGDASMPPRGLGGGGSPTVNLSINVSVDGHGKDGQELGDTIAERIKQLVPQELAAAFEQLAAEQGVDV